MAILALIVVLVVQVTISAPAAQALGTVVDLGTASTYSLLGGTSVANTGASAVSGNVGSYPGLAVSGFPPGILTGQLHPGDSAARQAQADALAAYSATAAQVPTQAIAGDLGGTTLTAGVYRSAAALSISSALTLDAQGDPAAVFIFQVNAAFGMAAAARIVLVNGAQSSRVFWQVVGATTLGASASFAGTLLGLAAISIGAGSTVVGRALSLTAALALDTSVILPEAPVNLGTAGAYSALAGTSVTNTGMTTLSGNVGVSPGTVLTGFPPGLNSGSTHVNDSQAAQAQVDLSAASTDAAARTPTGTLSGDLGGRTLTSGVYAAAGPLSLNGTVLLDGQGNVHSVFILQLDSTLTTSAGSTVKVVNGAQVSRVFWRVKGAVSLGAASAFTGSLLAQGAVSIGNSSGFLGRALSRAGAISLNGTTLNSEATIWLGTARSYALLASASVANTSTSTMNGDVGTSPGVAITGFPPGIITGATHYGDAAAAQAQADLRLAYNDAVARTPSASLAGDLGGRTLTAGVYRSAAALSVSTALILDGQGNPNAVFIFQVDAAFNTAAGSTITLVNGAQASRVFWQVTGAVTLGAACGFQGTILGLAAISIGAQCAFTGRALTVDGAITLNAATSTDPEPVPGPLEIVTAGAALSAVTLDGTTTQYATGLSTEWTITDARGSGASWTVSVEATTPTSAAGSVESTPRTLSVENLSITPGSITARPGSDPISGISAPPLALATSAQALITAVGSHRGTYVLTPAVSLMIPPNAYRSNFSGVIDHSELNPFISTLTFTIS
ncbi:ice-binding family protein [Cryobacterium sp. MLB-32]|uniref:ice-binding family protein n=1 Tax=Cryobacterium sp. MLB-32 TaxID=1529318 RepID=UPI000B2EBE15|nr:ice-binding family protein [Cryobacterium sp. MLB-32]